METMSHFSAIRITPSNVVNSNSAPQSSPPAIEHHHVHHVHRTIRTPSSPLRPASSSSAVPQLHTISSITGSHQPATSTSSTTMGVNTVSLSPGAAAVSRRSVSPRSTSPPGSQPQPATAGSAATPSSAASGGRCCETGRPIYTDPATGQTICSCQHEQMLQYQRLAQASLMGHGGPGGMHQLSMYSSAAYGPDGPGGMPPGAAGYMPPGAEQGHFYPNVPGMELKENMAGGAPWPYGYPYPYDPTMTPYSFNGYGMELNGARRKNATRETTSVLKAWLNEHKKNPYPTKGEKIMLAIITKMTLTQVSTWFANARRRLKKENKMTWEPKNRVDDDDPNICDDDDDDDDDNKSLGGGGSAGGGHQGMGMSGGMMKSSGTTSSDDGHGGRLSDSHQHLDSSNPGSPDVCMDMPGTGPMGGGYPMYHPMHFKPMTAGKPPGSSDYSPGSSTASTVNSKPRIWSLADMANDKAKDEGPVGAIGLSNEYKPHSVPGMYGHPMAGAESGLMSPSAILQRQNPTSYPHYIKSHLGPGGVGSAAELNKTDLFRSFTRTHATAAAAAAASAHLQAQPDYGFLESYQRALMHNGLAAASMHGMHPAHHPALTSLMAAGKPLHPQDPNSPAAAAAAAAHAAAAAAAAHAAAHAAATASFPPSGLSKGPPALQPPPMGGSHSARASPSSSSTSSRPENTTTPSSLPPPPPSSSSTTTGSPHVPPPPPTQHLQHPSHHELPLHLQSPHLQQHQHHLQQQHQQHHMQQHHHHQQQQQQHSPQHHLQPQHMQQHLHHLRHSPPAMPPAQQTLP